MKKITQKWIEFAKKDIRDAEILFKGRSYEGSIWHCHQALEKILKAIIVEKDKRIPKIHDLPRLSKECEITFSKTILEFLEDNNFLVGRESFANYPNTFLSLSSSLNMRYLDFLSDLRVRRTVFHPK